MDKIKNKHNEMANKDVLIFKGDFPAIIPEIFILAVEAFTDGEFRILANILYHARGKRTAWPGHETIGKETGKAVQQVSIHLSGLKKKGVLDWRRKQKEIGFGVYNEYVLEDPKVWWRKHGRSLLRRMKDEKKKKYGKRIEKARAAKEVNSKKF